MSGRYQSFQYNLGETARISRTFEPGLTTVDVRVRNLNTDAFETLTTGVANESSVEPGKYDWFSSDLDTQPTTETQYEVIFEDNEGQTQAQKITFGGHVDQNSVNTYQGAVWIDTVNGATGQDFPLGTPNNPSSNEVDALAIANSLGFTKFIVKGTLTLNNTYNGWVFESGSSALNDAVDINGQDVNDSLFANLTVQGACGGSLPKNISMRDCRYDTISGFDGVMFDGGILTSLGIEAGGDALLRDIKVITPGATITGGANTNISWSGAAGILTIAGLSGTSLLQMSAEDAVISLSASNTGGSYALGGRGLLIDNSSMTALFNELLSKGVIADSVWDAVASGHVASGSTGELLNLIDDIQSQQARTVCVQPTKIFVKDPEKAQVFVKPSQTAKVFVKETSP